MSAYPTFQWSCGPVLRKKTWVLRDSGIPWRAGMTFNLFFGDHPALEGWSYMSSCVNPRWTLLILKTNINVTHRNVLPIMYMRMVKYILLLGKTNVANTCKYKSCTEHTLYAYIYNSVYNMALRTSRIPIPHTYVTLATPVTPSFSGIVSWQYTSPKQWSKVNKSAFCRPSTWELRCSHLKVAWGQDSLPASPEKNRDKKECFTTQ